MTEERIAPPPDPAKAATPITLLTRWHLQHMRQMPRQFWRLRSLDHQTQAFPGRLWSHRWISRRSLLYTSTWASRAQAERWLASAEFAAFEASARSVGAASVVERFVAEDERGAS